MILIINIISITLESIIHDIINFFQILLNNVKIDYIRYKIKKIKRFLSDIIKKKKKKKII